MNITIGDKQYKVREAKTEQEKRKGLQCKTALPKDEGMLFYFDPSETTTMWMKDTFIPLDIIFINDDQEVTRVVHGEPMSKKLYSQPDTAYVLEVNKDSGIKEGDEFDFIESSNPVMKVLAQDGTAQMELWGGERIVSRRETKILIRKAKKADKSQSDSDYKTLGRYMFKVLYNQNHREPEYVSAP